MSDDDDMAILWKLFKSVFYLLSSPALLGPVSSSNHDRCRDHDLGLHPDYTSSQSGSFAQDCVYRVADRYS